MNRMELALCSAPLRMEGWASPVGGDGMYVMVTFRQGRTGICVCSHTELCLPEVVAAPDTRRSLFLEWGLWHPTTLFAKWLMRTIPGLL